MWWEPNLPAFEDESEAAGPFVQVGDHGCAPFQQGVAVQPLERAVLREAVLADRAEDDLVDLVETNLPPGSEEDPALRINSVPTSEVSRLLIGGLGACGQDSGGGAVAARLSGRVALPPPKSAKLPAVRDEIPPPGARLKG